MFDAPADTWYLWLGVATASALGLAVVVALPTTPPPDAARAAATVDSVATSSHDATGHAPLDATAIKLGAHRVSLRNDGGTTHATFVHGSITPAVGDPTLSAVLTGTPPERMFDDPESFRQAAATARNESATWQQADGRLLVRRVSWEGVHVTLVGA